MQNNCGCIKLCAGKEGSEGEIPIPSIFLCFFGHQLKKKIRWEAGVGWGGVGATTTQPRHDIFEINPSVFITFLGVDHIFFSFHTRRDGDGRKREECGGILLLATTK